MAALPLTHHDILALAAPFARAGWQVDLGATQRAARRIVFRAREQAACDGAPALRDSFVLESLGTGTCRLTRTLAMLDGGLRATVQGLGTDPATLLAQLQAVEPQRAFRVAPDYTIAFSYEFPGVVAPAPAPATAIARAAPVRMEPVLRRGEVRLDGATLTLELSPVKGVAGEVTLEPGGRGRPDLPQDLLAVLGWQWARLIATPTGWRTKLRLRGGLQRRSSGAVHALERAAGHLARTFSEPPARFHERWRGARWGVVLRRALPLLTVLSVMVAAPFLPREPFLNRPGLVTVLFQIPIALIALSFAVQELAQFEIPPLPRRHRRERWWPDATPAGAAAVQSQSAGL